MSSEILERLFSINDDNVVKEFVSIPTLKNHLYSLEKREILKGLQYDAFSFKEISQYNTFLVARISSEEIQEGEIYSHTLLGSDAEQILLPSGWDRTYPFTLSYPHLLKFLKRIAKQMGTITAYYKGEFSEGQWIVEAWIFDYRNGARFYDYGFIDYTYPMDGWGGGYYFRGTNPTACYREDHIGGRMYEAFRTPMMDFLCAYHTIFEWSPQVDWEKKRIKP